MITWMRSGSHLHKISHGIMILAGGFVLLLAIAWLMDTAFFALYHYEDFERASRRLERYFEESGYALRPIGYLLLYWTGLTFVGNLIANLGRERIFRVGASVLTCLLIVWPMARVCIYYYMRLDVTPGLAMYGAAELPGTVITVAPDAIATVYYVPLAFAPLFAITIGWAWLYGRKFATRLDEGEPSRWMEARPRPIAAGLLGVLLLAGPVLAYMAPIPERATADRERERQRPAEGESPYPAAEDLEIQMHAFESYFKDRFGFHLEEDTNIVFLVLESAREEFVDFERSKYFAPGLPETLRTEHFFVPVPHSSNSHYALYMGMHGARDFEEMYEEMRPEYSLPALLARQGYTNYFIYTDHTSFESETEMLRKLNMIITEKNHFATRTNPDTGQPYKSFTFGLDDVALVHEAVNIIDKGQQPFSISVVMSNSHYPYMNPDPDNFNRFPNNTLKGRHRNGIDYGLYIADRIVEEFEKKGMAENTLFVLFSDHGESFGEHGSYGHSFSIYNQEVRVPLVMRHPEFRRVWQEDPMPRGTMLDIYPTVFDLLGLQINHPLHGRSMFNPEYDLHVPLWVWRVDDFRGYVIGDTKWIYNDLEQIVFKMDLHDKVEKTWEEDDFDAHTDAFIETLMAIDMGVAAGQTGGAGEYIGPRLRMGPFAFGGTFQGGGGRLVTDCDELPRYMECAEEDDTGPMRGDPERKINHVNPSGTEVEIECHLCVGP